MYPGLRIPHLVAMTISLDYPKKCRDGAIQRSFADPTVVHNDDAINSCHSNSSSSQYATHGFAIDEFTGHHGQPKHANSAGVTTLQTPRGTSTSGHTHCLPDSSLARESLNVLTAVSNAHGVYAVHTPRAPYMAEFSHLPDY